MSIWYGGGVCVSVQWRQGSGFFPVYPHNAVPSLQRRHGRHLWEMKGLIEKHIHCKGFQQAESHRPTDPVPSWGPFLPVALLGANLKVYVNAFHHTPRSIRRHWCAEFNFSARSPESFPMHVLVSIFLEAFCIFFPELLAK